MRIVIIGPAHPFRGGISDTDESLCRALNKKGHEASIVTFTMQYPAFLFPGKTQMSKEEPPKNLKIQRLIHSMNPFNWGRSARAIAEMNPDLVIARYWIPYMAPSLGTIARRLKKTTCTIAMCDNVIPHEKRMADRALTQYFAKGFHGFITLSKKVEAELGDFTNAPTTSHPHPINDDLGVPMDKQAARQKLGLAPDGNYLLFFGLVRKYKGLDLLLNALGDERLKDNKIKLIVAGEFYDSEEEYLDIIKSYGMEDRVTLVNEFIAQADLSLYFSAADLVTQTYHTASQSGVTQMAFHFDRPILVTNVGGLSEVIKNDKNGYVVEKKPTAIADKILDFFVNDREQAFIAEVKKDKSLYTWDAFCDTLIGLHDRIKAET